MGNAMAATTAARHPAADGARIDADCTCEPPLGEVQPPHGEAKLAGRHRASGKVTERIMGAKRPPDNTPSLPLSATTAIRIIVDVDRLPAASHDP